MSLTRHWSQADCLSRIVLTHAPRQATVWLSFDVEVEEKDRPILAAAVASGCTHLWTIDRKHFGHLYGKTVQGVIIVSSLQLLDVVAQSVQGQ